MIYRRGKYYVFDFILNGKRYKQSTRQANRETAKRMEADYRSALASGAPLPGAKPKASLTIAALLDAVEADYKLGGILGRRIVSALRIARRDFGEHDALKFSTADVDQYIERRIAEGAKPASINRKTELVRHAYHLAAKHKRLSREQIPHFRHLKEDNAREGFFSPGDFAKLVAHLPDYLADYCRFGFLTGWRKNEISSLRWSDVEDGVIRLRGRNSKNREPRQVMLVGELAAIVQRRRVARTVNVGNVVMMAEFVFHRVGEQIDEMRGPWARACAASGNEGRLFHDLRRSAVRNMVRGGVPQHIAMKISGHKTDSMFRRYNVVNEDDLREAQRRIERYNAEQAQAGR